MKFFKATLGLAALVISFAAAVPAPVSRLDNVLEARSDDGEVTIQDSAMIRVYRTDTCGTMVDQVTLFEGGKRCIPYSNVRSITLKNNGCSIKTWSGSNCAGSHYNVKEGCNSVLYASVSISC